MQRIKWTPLKGRMYEYDVSQLELAKAIGKGLTYTSARINGHKPWTLDDMKVIGKLLNIPEPELIPFLSQVRR